MKAKLILLLALFIGVSYQACCESCISKLTIDDDWQTTDEWSLPSVQTYSVASTSSVDVDEDGFCGNVFKEYGSCCNQTELYERACSWNDRLKSRMTRVIKALDLMTNYTESIGKFITDIETNSEAITSGGGESTSESGPRKPFSINVIVNAGYADSKPTAGTNMCGSSLSFVNLPTANIGKGKEHVNLTSPMTVTPWTDRLGYIRDDSSSKREAREAAAKENYADCYDALSKVRTNTLCLRCSGAASFYYSGSGYSASENTCKYIIKKCAVVFSAISEANALYTTLANFKKSLGGMTNAHAYGKVASNEEIEEWSTCADNVDECLQNQYTVNKLCSQVSLSSDNQALEGNINTIGEGIGAADAIIAGNSAKKGEQDLSMFSESRRVLASEESSSEGSSSEGSTDTIVYTESDDGYGYMTPSSSGPDLVYYFSYNNNRTEESMSESCKIIFTVLIPVLTLLISLI